MKITQKRGQLLCQRYLCRFVNIVNHDILRILLTCCTVCCMKKIDDKLGAHISSAGGVSKAVARAASLPCRAFQLFTKNQNRWVSKPLEDSEIEKWFSELKAYNMDTSAVCVHDSYLINLASPDPVNLEKSIDGFVEEIQRCATLKIPHLVWHPGSHVGQGEEIGLTAVAKNMDRAIEIADDDSVTLCIETTAGQGTNLGWQFSHLRDIIAQSKYQDKIGICIDTCHIFAAGYQLETKKEWDATLNDLDEKVGLDKVKVIHVNDSKKPLGSRVDRHERIGEGEIGINPFKHLINEKRLKHAMMVLEVPGGMEAWEEDLKLLRSL
jgi:deoxyribonuclease IV